MAKSKGDGCGFLPIIFLVFAVAYCAAPNGSGTDSGLVSTSTSKDETETVTFESVPSGAAVYINDEKQKRGTTPIALSINRNYFVKYRLVAPPPLKLSYTRRVEIVEEPQRVYINFADVAVRKRRKRMIENALKVCRNGISEDFMIRENQESSSGYYRYKVMWVKLDRYNVRVKGINNPDYRINSYFCDYNDYTKIAYLELLPPVISTSLVSPESRAKNCYVRGYTRSDGTRVKSYYRQCVGD